VKFTHIDHVTVIITDPKRAVAFYRDVLGLPEVSSPSTFEGAGLNVRWFKVGQQYVHLFIAPEPDKPGRRHFALRVGDAQAARQHLTGLGVTIRETTPIPGAERFFIADPDGNRIEIIQWKDTSEIRPLGDGIHLPK
jgi:catechol 2,3-dioxygenase-like lactoylglutathione lyase family enzyme